MNSPAAGLPRPALLSGAERLRAGVAVLISAACLAALALLLTLPPHAYGPRFSVAVLACTPILLLRRWSLVALAMATAISAVQMTSGTLSPPLVMMLAGAGYAVAVGVPRRLSVRAVLAAAAVLAFAYTAAALTTGRAPVAAEGIMAFLPLAAAWFVGDSVAARRRYLAGLAEQAERERAAEAERARQEVREERVRIARELHDVVAHTLTVITVQAGVGKRLMDKRPEVAAGALESIETIGRTAQDELRVVLGLLRDEEAGAAARAPAPGLIDLKELAETVRVSGTPVELRMQGTDREFSPALQLSVYRVVQEALTNVVKHAPGARATVDLAVSAAGIRVEVTDDGGAAGGRARPLVPGTGHGIAGMRERITAFGGWLVAEPLAGGGFRVLAEAPAEAAV